MASLQEGSVSDVASEPVEGPRPGSIEYARAAKAEKQALKQPAVAVFGLKPTLTGTASAGRPCLHQFSGHFLTA